MEKSKLLDRCGALGEDRLLLAKVLDRAEQAQRRNIPAATDFLSPAQRVQAEDLLRLAGIAQTAYVSLGVMRRRNGGFYCLCRTGWRRRTRRPRVLCGACGRSFGRRRHPPRTETF